MVSKIWKGLTCLLLQFQLVSAFVPGAQEIPTATFGAGLGSVLEATRGDVEGIYKQGGAFDVCTSDPDNIHLLINRRRILIGGVVSAVGPFVPALCRNERVWASDIGDFAASAGSVVGGKYLQAESAKLDLGLLESRVASNVVNPPPYGMEGADVFYPS